MAGDVHRQHCEPERLALLHAEDIQERQFYAIMHHLATVLWMMGKAVEGLAALSALLEWTAEDEPSDGSHRGQ